MTNERPQDDDAVIAPRTNPQLAEEIAQNPEIADELQEQEESVEESAEREHEVAKHTPRPAGLAEDQRSTE